LVTVVRNFFSVLLRVVFEHKDTVIIKSIQTCRG